MKGLDSVVPLSKIKATDKFVKGNFTYMSDKKNHGVIEKWIMLKEDNLFGDCEDFMLTACAYLIDTMFVEEDDLEFAICVTQRGEGHAVLLVKCEDGYWYTCADTASKWSPSIFTKEPYDWIKHRNINEKKWWFF